VIEKVVGPLQLSHLLDFLNHLGAGIVQSVGKMNSLRARRPRNRSIPIADKRFFSLSKPGPL
jgi:hypothetical protein